VTRQPIADWRNQPRFLRQIYEQLDDHTGGAGPEIIAVYLQVLPERKEAMIEALVAGDFAALKRFAHMAKSGSLTLGLLRLGALCETIEKTLAAELPMPDEMASAIVEEFEAAGTLLAEFAKE